MKLSIIIPVYNEEKTIRKILEQVISVSLPHIEKEIIIVDDGSTDLTATIISQFQFPNSQILKHKKNQGKGAAVRTGIKKAKGEYIIIQDADLEYDPRDILKLCNVVKKGKAHVVYGSRLKRLPNFARDEKRPIFFLHYLGNKALSFFTSILYGAWITDMESGYKLFPKDAVRDMTLHAKGFEFEPEITAKFLKRGYKIHEIAISTNPRGHEEGKKLNTIRDGYRAFWTLIKYRIKD